MEEQYDSTFFMLLAIVNITAQPFSRLFEKQYDVTLNEWRVIRVLAFHPGISQGDIAYHLGLDKMTISRTLQKLSQRKRISKKENPANRRGYLVRLSAEGRRLYDVIKDHGAEREERLFSGLTSAQRQEFRRLTSQLLADARKMILEET